MNMNEKPTKAETDRDEYEMRGPIVCVECRRNVRFGHKTDCALKAAWGNTRGVEWTATSPAPF